MLVPRTISRSTSRPERPIRVAIFGSTGSIGKSALEVIASQRDLFEVVAIVAKNNASLLNAQARTFGVRYAGLFDSSAAKEFAVLPGCELVVGADVHALAGLHDVDVVLAAIVGAAGLSCVEVALRNGKTIALANKESLVTAGPLVRQLQQQSGARIIPVDSEHSAIFQALQGQLDSEISELILTASGGPFREMPLAELSTITPQQAVKHPRWSMGAKISVDSATMFNKALELMEAHWLFDVAPARIKVLVHPQSIVHSLVSLVDGTQLAQLSVPDMKGPIGYALSYPYARFAGCMPQLDLRSVGRLDFFDLDEERFPAVALARECLADGSSACAVFNVANEAAVEAFLAGKLRFNEICSFVRAAVREERFSFPQSFQALHGMIESLSVALRKRLI